MSPETTFRKQASAYVHAAGGVVATESGIVDADEFEAAPMGVDAEAGPLRALVAKAAPSVSRMASRFGQLAVLGAADCLRRLRGNVDPATRIYLATGLGDVAHTDALYFGVMPPRSEMPPPARFATSGNNMAAFFVAQHAGITARNLTVSQDELSLECALGFALSDLASGAADAAFVGGG